MVSCSESSRRKLTERLPIKIGRPVAFGVLVGAIGGGLEAGPDALPFEHLPERAAGRLHHGVVVLVAEIAGVADDVPAVADPPARPHPESVVGNFPAGGRNEIVAVEGDELEGPETLPRHVQGSDRLVRLRLVRRFGLVQLQRRFVLALTPSKQECNEVIH